MHFKKPIKLITGQHQGHHHHHHGGRRHHRSHQRGGGGHRDQRGHPIEKEAHTVPTEHMVHATSTASAMTMATSNLVATATTLVRKHSTSRDPSSTTNTDLTYYNNDHYYSTSSPQNKQWPPQQQQRRPQTASIWTVETTAAAKVHTTRLRRNLTTNSA